MSRRELIKKIIAREKVEHCGFWLGKPHQDLWPTLHRYFGTATEEELRVKLGDDCRWICPQFYADVYQDPHGRETFRRGPGSDEAHGAFRWRRTRRWEEVERFPWPKPEYLNFDSCIRDLRNAGDVYRMSGFWTCFYHNLGDLFGMEEYFVKMYTNPEVLQAATDKVCEFYYEANEKFFAAAGKEMDGFFFGNDFGTQCSLICGPDQFDQFILPWFRKFTEQGHRHGYQVILHSCGAVADVIERLIAAGVDCLHPLQAKAKNMDAETLARRFGGRITFLGGIDTQDLMTNGTPEEVRADVHRVRRLLEPYLIVSPSHEALLANVPPTNVAAMALAVAEKQEQR